jgi:phenylalanine-4-hydroxylase
MDDGDLEAVGIIRGKDCVLEFESGVQINGRLEGITRKNGALLLLTFSGCRVICCDQVLFDPSWGTYDMAVGDNLVSAFSGPADPDAFGLRFPVPKEKTHKIIHTPEARELHVLYQKVRDVRESGNGHETLPAIWSGMVKKYPNEWLLGLEIYELSRNNPSLTNLSKGIASHLEKLKTGNEEIRALIDNGLEIFL